MRFGTTFVRVSAVCLVLLAASACGSSSRVSSGKVTFSDGTFHIAGKVDTSSLVRSALGNRSVLGIRIGTDASAVRSRFGAPQQVNRVSGLTCSWYPAEKPGTYVNGIGFCANSQHRVAKILGSVHG